MIITEKKVLEIKDNVKCPELGFLHYGKWGTLRQEQRILINDLCDSWLYKSELLDNYVKNWNELKKWCKENQYDDNFDSYQVDTYTTYNDVLKKIRELQGDDKN